MMGRGARAVSIIALVFAPIAMLISYAIYTRDLPIDRTPLLIGAVVIGALEIAAAIATLMQRPSGPRLFMAYAVLALIHVIADGWYLVVMPARESRGMASQVIDAFVGGFGVLVHLAWSCAAAAWSIVVLVLAAQWMRKAHR